MAASSDAGAVKSLNTSSGRRRFVFKTFSQRIEEIKIDVYRSLDPVKAEPSEGSSFFRDCLGEYRELNTAEDFISFYEEMFPLVQTLPQIILQKNLIVSRLLSRLKMEARLSHEPILRLLAALSRDLLEDFTPFLQRVVDALEDLLENGADRDPEIIEQIFTSWSQIMMYLLKYLMEDVTHILRITSKLRYYPKDHIREFMAESVSFVLRKTPVQKRVQDIRKVMIEVVEEPSEIRKSGAGALISHVIRLTPSRLHSETEKLIPLLVDDSTFNIDASIEGAGVILEVLSIVFQRLYVELDPIVLTSIWKCFVEEISDSVTTGNSSHLIRLLTLLISMAQNDYLGRLSDYKPMVELVSLLVRTFVPNRESEVTDNILQLMLCILDGLSNSKNMGILLNISSQWRLVFDLRSQSLLMFIKDLMMKDSCIFSVFEPHITSALDNLVELSAEEVVHLLINFCEKLRSLDGKSKEKLPRIHAFMEKTLHDWIRNIKDAAKGNPCLIPFEENKLAVLWGVVRCYSQFADAQANPALLLNLIDALDELLMVKSKSAGFPEATWQNLIGSALRSYHKLVNVAHDESAITRLLVLVKKNKLSPHILSAVADILDSMPGSEVRANTRSKFYLPEHVAGNVLDAVGIFAENLCHANKVIRLSTLRILCHYELLPYDLSSKGHPVAKKMRKDDSVISHPEDPDYHVLNLLKSIEAMPLAIATSRKVIILISKIQMSLSVREVPEGYMPLVLYGIIGILHNRFSYLWNPALECLGVLIGLYSRSLWDIYVEHLDLCQSFFLTSSRQCGGRTDDSTENTDLVGLFSSHTFPLFDSTPCATVLSLLIQSLQKIPSVAESHSKQLIPLFLKFLGYNIDDLRSLNNVTSKILEHKGKEWHGVLKEWLNLFRLLQNPKAFYQNQLFKDVLLYRLLDEDDTDLQMTVLDCLLNWRDDFLLPYGENLRNLVNAKDLRDEITRWSLSRNSMNPIDVQHRIYIVPVVIRILIPKVRNLRTLACQKSSRLYHRRAVLGFIAELDVDELPLFFWLLIRPLIPQVDDETCKSFWSSSESSKGVADTADVLEHFTIDSVKALTWKKRYGFLHVVEDILAVFDEPHLDPFLDLLTNCVVRILASCTSSLDSAKNTDCTQNCPSFELNSEENGDETNNQLMERTSVKQLKDLRSLCLKIISLVLIKYEAHEFGGAFWDLFFTSIRPLISNFKHEGASGKEPSSLFNCFLAMSKSYKLAPLLDLERSLVPDIFSLLTVPSASESVLSSVFKFIKNLLKLDYELGAEDNYAKNILLRHLNVLICSLHGIFTNDTATKRKGVGFLSKREFTIFKLLSKYVKEPSVAKLFLDILLPLLRRSAKNVDNCINVLQIIQQVVPVLGSGSGGGILKSIVPLLVSAGFAVRMSICDVLDALAANNNSLLTVAKVLIELNSTVEMKMDDLDYDKVICAYDKVNADFFYSIPEEQALLILAHAVHDMSSEELIIRQSAFRLLVSFVQFSCQILDGSLESYQKWSVANIQRLLNNFLMKHMGYAMSKDAAVRKVWIDLLREMVRKLPKLANLDSYRALCSEDAEQDFFNNIVHLQKHRRARALTRFRNTVSSGNLSEVIMNRVFVPLLFAMFYDVQDGKDEHIRSTCSDALASISGCMKWNQYYSLLIRCFRDLTAKPEKQKPLLRLICSILDHFHFPEKTVVHEAKVSACDVPDPYNTDLTSVALENRTSSVELPVIQTCLHKSLLPKIQKLLTSDPDNVCVTTSLVALKLLKLLPSEIMELQLPTIIHRISNFLKNRLESVRDEARTALAACLKELGIEYLQFIVKVLKSTLKRGFELHVLGYTLNFLLSKFILNPGCGKLDYCLEDLLSIVENDVLGDVSEEKEVEKIASKMKETKKQKSYETLKLIAQSITFKTHALKLLSPVTVHLQKQLNQKIKSKFENMLNHIAEGIKCNPSVDQTELFIFAFGLIANGMSDEDNENEDTCDSGASKIDRNDEGVPARASGRLLNVDRRFSHLITAFALEVLQNYMKNLKLNKEDGQLLSLLDPFVEKLHKCLSSKYENIITAALRCLSPLVRLPLPSLESEANKIKNSLLVMAQGSANASSQLAESCIKLLTVLLRSTRSTLSTDQLHMLLQFPLFVDLAKNPSFIGLSLLKAIVDRKLIVAEIYDVIQIVAELMVQSQSEPTRKKCSQIFLQFLLGYHLSEKRMEQHLDFLLANLRYEHATGREAVLEMLHAIIMKFPRKVVDAQSQTLFVHLVVSLANDDSSDVRSMTAAAIKCLIGHVSANSLNSILEYTLSWYLGGKQNLWAAGAQVLGLLVEEMGKSFRKNLSIVLPVMRRILHSALSALASKQQNSLDETAGLLWKEAYYSLVMLEKILHQFHDLFFDRDLEDMWEMLFEFLLHPHMWLRNISNRILSSYFVSVTDAFREKPDVSMETFFLMKPGILFLVAVSLIGQLKVPSTDNAAGTLILQNLEFAICSLHSFFGKKEYLDTLKFWSNLETPEQDRFFKAFGILDPRKGRNILASFTSDVNGQHSLLQHPFISYLLQRMGKISFQMEATQMKTVFNCFRSISKTLLGLYTSSSAVDNIDLHSYAYHMLLPLYRVCEGYTGTVVTDDMKQFAQEVCDHIRDTMGTQNFVQVYSQIRKNLKMKRDKRKQGEKIMAVVNPVRNAKRKLRIAAKHKAHKKRKITSMKMGRWMH